MRRALFDLFSAGVVEPDELLTVLHDHFTEAERHGISEIAFPDAPNARLFVRVKSDRVVDIRPGPRFDKAEASAIADDIRRKLVENQERRIAVGVAFSSSPVTGSYRDPGGAFQLLPAPADAPRPPALNGRHPFLIEYPVVAGPDPIINVERQIAAATELTWLLNAVLLDRFTLIGQKSLQTWVVIVGARSSGPEWAQESYSIPGLQGDVGEFSASDAPPIELVPEATYYSRRGMASKRALDLPSTFARDVEQFEALDDDRRRRFLRAGQWRTAGHDLWGRHMASWLIAQVAAIETLANEPADGEVCPACGNDTSPGPTATFKNFLDRYARGAGTRRDNDRLYEVRSGLVHGAALLHSDSPLGSLLLALAADEWRSLSLLGRSVLIASVNWLRAQDGDAGRRHVTSLGPPGAAAPGLRRVGTRR